MEETKKDLIAGFFEKRDLSLNPRWELLLGRLVVVVGGGLKG